MTNTVAQRVALGGVLVLLAVVLNGCGGCDTDAGKKCAEPFVAAIGSGKMETICPAMTAYTGCIDSAGCCSEDDMKKALDGYVATYNTVCTGANVVTNKCT